MNTIGISAHAHVAANALDGAGGWAEGLLDGGRALDPSRIRILAFDYVGACGGIDAPIDTADQADAVALLLDALGIDALEAFVGYSYGALEPRDWNALLDDYGVVHDLFVSAEGRRSGIGRALLDRMVSELESRGAERIVLFTMVSNEPAQALFASRGFRPTMLEDASWVTPYLESYVSEKLPGVVSGAKHSFEQFPGPADYPSLAQGFAREGARPS